MKELEKAFFSGYENPDLLASSMSDQEFKISTARRFELISKDENLSPSEHVELSWLTAVCRARVPSFSDTELFI